MLKNVKAPKLERKNKIKVKNKVEKKKIQYEQNIRKRANYDSYKKHNKKEQQIGEKHYWSDNYIPKEYGKYKETKNLNHYKIGSLGCSLQGFGDVSQIPIFVVLIK